MSHIGLCIGTQSAVGGIPCGCQRNFRSQDTAEVTISVGTGVLNL